MPGTISPSIPRFQNASPDGSMTLLELGKFYPPVRGGIETLLKEFCEGFVDQGASVECVVANTRPANEEQQLAGVRVRRLASFGSWSSTSLAPTYPLATRRLRADLIHAHAPNPLADLAILSAPRHVPVVLTWHSDVVRQAGLLRWYGPILRAVLRRADRIVVATQNQLDASRWLPRVRSKCSVIPFGLDLQRFKLDDAQSHRVAALRSEVGHRAILLNVGRLVGYKGQRHAIEAIRTLDAVLWIVGTGPLESELKQFAAQSGVSDRVRFWGDVPELKLPDLYHASDVFVFPSVTPNEAFGMAQIEAMACSKPLVACQLDSGVPFVCQHCRNGWIVPPGDPKALAEALACLISNPGLRHSLGSAGQHRARTEFSRATMVNQYWDLFRDLLARAAP